MLLPTSHYKKVRTANAAFDDGQIFSGIAIVKKDGSFVCKHG